MPAPWETNQLEQRAPWEPPSTQTGKNPQPSIGKSVYQPPGGKAAPSSVLTNVISLLGRGLTPFVGPSAQAATGPVVAGAAGGIAGGLTGAAGPVVAPAVFTAVDTALRRLNYPEEDVSKSILTSAGDAAINEIGGAALRGAARGIKGLLNIDQPEIFSLKPTTSQAFRAVTGQEAPVTKFIEDVFSSSSKMAARDESAQLAAKQATAKASLISGRLPSEVENPQGMGQFIKGDIQSQLNASYRESARQAEAAHLIAKNNITQISGSLAASPEIDALAKQQTGSSFASLNPQDQQNVLNIANKIGIKPPVKTIEGPVTINDSLNAANKIVQQRQAMYATMGIKGIPSDDPLPGLVNRLITETNAKFDPQTGLVVSSDPISFKEAWQFKREMDQFGYAKSAAMPKAAIRSATDYTSTFENLSDTLNNDIDASLPKWTNDPNGLAQRAWNNAKQTVHERQLLFNTKGDKLGAIIDKAQSPLPSINKIIDDPQQLQRALNVGEITFPSGVVSSSNLRADLQGYQFQRIFQNALERSPIDPSKVRIDPTKLSAIWTDPDMQDSLKLLYNQNQRADIEQFFKNIANTQDKMVALPLAKKIWLTHAGIAIGAGLLSGSLSVGAETGATTVGIYLTGNQIGKLLTGRGTFGIGKSLPRVLVNIAAGQPLGMSGQAISRALMGALQGERIGLLDNKNNITQYKVDSNNLTKE